jgi:hypothetical protein
MGKLWAPGTPIPRVGSEMWVMQELDPAEMKPAIIRLIECFEEMMKMV